MLHRLNLATAIVALVAKMLDHLLAFVFDMLDHIASAHAHLPKNFSGKVTLHIPCIAIGEHHPHTLIERSNAVEESVRAAIHRITIVEFANRFAARYDHNVLVADGDANYRAVNLVQMMPNQVEKLVSFSQARQLE